MVNLIVMSSFNLCAEYVVPKKCGYGHNFGSPLGNDLGGKAENWKNILHDLPCKHRKLTVGKQVSEIFEELFFGRHWYQRVGSQAIEVHIFT